VIIVEVTPISHEVDIELLYATKYNFTGKPIYSQAHCYLNEEASKKLLLAKQLAKAMKLKLHIFDALRPVEAQWKLWEHTPDPTFLSDPRIGSPHSRGAAIDLSLSDNNGNLLDMGTEFDTFSHLSHHGSTEISVSAQKNRFLLLGLMSTAGWDFYKNEWWHYQLFNSKDFPLINNKDLPKPMI
jgi:D-alanyl-D-alanine dipeptidase|tara:strand:- start:9608 stop:10159 length:552 start_codon:yes stop_codon:yes gene_type:complete